MIITGSTSDLQIVARPPKPYGAYYTLPQDTYAGRDVSPEGALALSHVYGAVRLVSTVAGTLPLETIDTMNGGNVVNGARIALMLRWRPNQDMGSSVLWSLVVSHLLLRGNAYLTKIRDANGIVSELFPINPVWVHPFRDETGAKLFRILATSGSSWIDKIFDSTQILHIVGHSVDDGLMGASPISQVRNRIGVHMAASEVQARLYARGLTTKGVLSTSANLSPEAAARIKEQWQAANHGIDNAGDVAILPGGLTFNPVSLSLEDAQFVQAMNWSATEIATLFGLPASRLNADAGRNSMRYANVGQDEVHFVKQAVLPQLRFIEDALNMDPDLFGYTSAWVPRFNPDAALRADAKTRSEMYALALAGQPWMDVADVRSREGLPPKEILPVASAAAPAVSIGTGGEKNA